MCNLKTWLNFVIQPSLKVMEIILQKEHLTDWKNQAKEDISLLFLNSLMP